MKQKNNNKHFKQSAISPMGCFFFFILWCLSLVFVFNQLAQKIFIGLSATENYWIRLAFLLVTWFSFYVATISFFLLSMYSVQFYLD